MNIKSEHKSRQLFTVTALVLLSSTGCQQHSYTNDVGNDVCRQFTGLGKGHSQRANVGEPSLPYPSYNRCLEGLTKASL